MYVENVPAVWRNEDVLSDLPTDFYALKANEKIPDNYKYPLATIQAAKNKTQTNTGSLRKLFKLKVGAKIMLADNIDIQDRVIYGQTGNI